MEDKGSTLGCGGALGIAILLVLALLVVGTINGAGGGGVFQAEDGTPVSRLTWQGWQPLEEGSRPDQAQAPTAAPAPLPTPMPSWTPWPSPISTRAAVAMADFAPIEVEPWPAYRRAPNPAPVDLAGEEGPGAVRPGWSFPWAWVLGAGMALSMVVSMAVFARRSMIELKGEEVATLSAAAATARAARGAPASSSPDRSFTAAPRSSGAQPGPANLGLQRDVDEATRLLVDALTRLGLAHKTQGGPLQQVRIGRRRYDVQGGELLLELDTQRLPHGVRAGELTAVGTLQHLAAVLHRPVHLAEGHGITYAVAMAPGRLTGRLPGQVELEEAMASWNGRPYTFPLGASPAGPVWETLRGHYLVAGETCSGKTTWLVATSLALAAIHTPDELALVIVDPKGVDLVSLGNLPHAAGDVATSPDEAAAALAELIGVVDERRRLFLQAGQALGAAISNLEIYNRKTGARLPRVLAIVDEVTDLAMQLGGPRSDFFRNLVRLASIGRSFGIHLLLATQNPKAEVLDTLARGNLAGRICFRVPEAVQSRIVLGEGGAEKLPRMPGRMLAKLDGRILTLQGYMVPDADMQALVTMGRLVQPGGDDQELTGRDVTAGGEVTGAAAPLGPVQVPLTDLERRMVRYAVEQLGGRFPEREIVEGLRLQDRDLYRQARGKLEALGILDRGARGALQVIEGIDVDEF